MTPEQEIKLEEEIKRLKKRVIRLSKCLKAKDKDIDGFWAMYDKREGTYKQRLYGHVITLLKDIKSQLISCLITSEGTSLLDSKTFELLEGKLIFYRGLLYDKESYKEGKNPVFIVMPEEHTVSDDI